MKIALAQIESVPGKIAINKAKICKIIQKAESFEADLVVFPELALPGYLSMDFFTNNDFLEENLSAIKEIQAKTENISVILGFVDIDRKITTEDGSYLKYNAAALIHERQIKFVHRKIILPNSDIFFEKRYFESAAQNSLEPMAFTESQMNAISRAFAAAEFEIKHFGESTNSLRIGGKNFEYTQNSENLAQIPDMLKLCQFDGYKIGLQICADLWDTVSRIKPTAELNKLGADFFLNLSASPFWIGKMSERLEIVHEKADEFQKPFFYLNGVGCHDGYDGQILFDGQSLVVNEKNKVLYQAGKFTEELILVDFSEKMQVQKIVPVSLKEVIKDETIIAINSENFNLTSLKPIQTVCKNFFLSSSDDTEEVLQEIYEGLVFGIREFFKSANQKLAFIGLSGGIDSALVASLAVEALGNENVIAVSMPSKLTGVQSRTDADFLAKNLGIKLKTIHIDGILQCFDCELKGQIEDKFTNSGEKFLEQKIAFPKDSRNSIETEFTSTPSGLKSITSENLQARIRGNLLMALSNQLAGLVLCTSNKTEIATGYSTLYGDTCGALCPIGDLHKNRVYGLATFINKIKQKQIIPDSILSKPPSAELRPNQTDEESLGVSYKILVPLVEDIVENNKTRAELEIKYSPELVLKVKNLIQKSEFKRRQLPPAIKITKKSFGLGRRMPMF